MAELRFQKRIDAWRRDMDQIHNEMEGPEDVSEEQANRIDELWTEAETLDHALSLDEDEAGARQAFAFLSRAVKHLGMGPTAIIKLATSAGEVL